MSTTGDPVAILTCKRPEAATHRLRPSTCLLPSTRPRTWTELPLEMPALRATKVMKKLATNKERAEFITAHCTGLMIPDLAGLTVPDWTELQERIDDFLNKPADFFRSATSK